MLIHNYFAQNRYRLLIRQRVRDTSRMCQTLTRLARCDGDSRTRRKIRLLTSPYTSKKHNMRQWVADIVVHHRTYKKLRAEIILIVDMPTLAIRGMVHEQSP